MTDSSPTVVTNLASVVTTMWDRGLLSIALDPGFTTGRPYLYALYSLNAPPGGTAPTYLDNCFYSGFGNDGVCGVTTGRLSRFEIGPGNTAIGETVLLTDWCQLRIA